MELEIQNQKADYIDFYKEFYFSQFKKKILLFTLIPLIISYLLCSHNFVLFNFLLIAFIISVLLAIISILIPYYFSIKKLNYIFNKKNKLVEKIKLTITDDSLQTQTEEKTIEWKWISFTSFSTSYKYLALHLQDKSFILIPKRFFNSNNDFQFFLGAISNNVSNSKFINPINNTSHIKPLRPPYLLSLLCLLPFLGVIAGLIIIYFAIANYKSKSFAITGLIGLIFSTIFTLFIIFQIKNISSENYFNQITIDLSIQKMNSIVKEIEFYKMQNNEYPDSLQQIENTYLGISDPAISNKKNQSFYFKKTGMKYYLFSISFDNKPFTNDDIYPTIGIKDSTKCGLILK